MVGKTAAELAAEAAGRGLRPSHRSPAPRSGAGASGDCKRSSEDSDMSLAKTQSVEEIKARNKELIDEVLEVYPEKTAKRRAKHLGTFTRTASPIAASSRTSSRSPA